MIAVDEIKPSASRSFQWIFYLVTGFYFGTVGLRSLLIYQGTAELPTILIKLGVWLVLFVSEPILSKRQPYYFWIYVVLQTGVMLALLASPGYTDFFAILFAILSMQVMLHLSVRAWVAWMSIWALATLWLLWKTYESQVFPLVLIYTAGNVFYSFYVRAIRQAQAVHAENLSLAHDLQVANHKLQAYAAQMEQLVVVRERNRLARDLHDSVTQTVFSMTLTIQSALLLLERDASQVEAQLDRLSQLTKNALSEMQLLISELQPDEAGQGGLAAMLRHYLASGHLPDNLSVELDVSGEGNLELMEEQSLFHIIQESLNNIMKHAHSSTAQVRLHLSEPLWVEVTDQGKGFDLQQAQNSGQVGLSSMRERAAEIGWDLQIRSAPGTGTCIRVEKLPETVRQV